MRRQMENPIDAVIRIQAVEPDSQYRLRPCVCGSDNAAYVLFEDCGEELWRAQCFDCGAASSGYKARHDAQMEWNGVGV